MTAIKRLDDIMFHIYNLSTDEEYRKAKPLLKGV